MYNRISEPSTCLAHHGILPSTGPNQGKIICLQLMWDLGPWATEWWRNHLHANITPHLPAICLA